jgi:hypothetical protein
MALIKESKARKQAGLRICRMATRRTALGAVRSGVFAKITVCIFGSFIEPLLVLSSLGAFSLIMKAISIHLLRKDITRAQSCAIISISGAICGLDS